MCSSICPSSKEKQQHQCADGISGTVIENVSTSFADFVKSCGISLRKTLKDVVSTKNIGASAKETMEIESTGTSSFTPKYDPLSGITGTNVGHGCLLAGSSHNNNGLPSNTNIHNQPSAIRSPKRHFGDFKGPYQRMGSPTKRTKCTNNYSQQEPGISKCFNLVETRPEETNISETTEFDKCQENIIEVEKSDLHNEDCQARGKSSMMSSFNNAVKSIFHCSCSTENEADVPDKIMRANSLKMEPIKGSECSSLNLKLKDSIAPGENAALSSANIDNITIDIEEENQETSSQTMNNTEIESPIITGVSQGVIAAQPKITSPVDQENLETMKHIIFLDIDNWPKLFQKLPTHLPERTFVWGFFGGANVWSEPML